MDSRVINFLIVFTLAVKVAYFGHIYTAQIEMLHKPFECEAVEYLINVTLFLLCIVSS